MQLHTSLREALTQNESELFLGEQKKNQKNIKKELTLKKSVVHYSTPLRRDLGNEGPKERNTGSRSGFQEPKQASGGGKV